MCYFVVLMSSLLSYNVENRKKKERKTLEWVGVSKCLTGTVCIIFFSMPPAMTLNYILISNETLSKAENINDVTHLNVVKRKFWSGVATNTDLGS